MLWVAVRARKLREEQAFAVWRQATRLFAGAERPVDGDEILRAALKYGITAYDAHFVALAERLGDPLVTTDHKSLADKCPGTVVVRLSSFVTA